MFRKDQNGKIGERGRDQAAVLTALRLLTAGGDRIHWWPYHSPPAVLIYGCEIAIKLFSAAWRARNSLSASSPSISAQPATVRIPCSTSIRRNSGSRVEAAMSPKARSNRKLTATSGFES